MVWLNEVHTVKSEKQVIEDAGQFIEDGKINGVLDAPRTFGDFKTKHKNAVVCKPTLTVTQRTKDDSFIFLATKDLIQNANLIDHA